MSTKYAFLPVARDELSLIDRYLAAKEVDIDDRPLRAALEFATECIQRVSDDGKEWVPDFTSTDFMGDRWFRLLYRECEDWYQKRYPAEFPKRPPSTLTGLVLIWGNPYAIHVPAVVRRADEPGKWISFPDYVLDTENPVDWIAQPPALSQLSRNEMTKLVEACVTVASLVRTIDVRIMGIHARDEVVAGLLNKLRRKVLRAAEEVVSSRSNAATSDGAWEVQMACECALKALLQKKAGRFRETHDLFVLYDDAVPYGFSLNRDLLKASPHGGR
jgi:hypothetical protein